MLLFRKMARQAKQEAISQNVCLLRIRETFRQTANTAFPKTVEKYRSCG
jgi:hypothetical protein